MQSPVPSSVSEASATAPDQWRRFYETILSATPDFVYVFDLQERFTYVNRALLDTWGKTWDEAIGRTCLELGYEPWHAEMHGREIHTVVATKSPIRGEVPFTGINGRRIYDYIFVPVFGPDGEVEAVAGTTRDVTHRKIEEERRRESEERLRFMAESMPQKIFTARSDGSIDYFNQQWFEFAGLPFASLSGRGWETLLHPADEAPFREAWTSSLQSGEPFQATHRIRRADGAYRWHLSRAHAMRSPAGDVSMWIGSSTDIHEQKATEEALRQANQDLEQFAYTATHDLQEPLRSVMIYGELLLRRHADQLEGTAAQYIEFMRTGAARMEMLVRDLLSYTRASRLDMPAECHEDANTHLRIALENLSTAIAESDALVTVKGDLPMVSVLGTHLQQLFQNLIGNAIKYRHLDQRPLVSVSAVRCEGQWCFMIEDNGIGIESEYKERIFGLFKRLHTGDKYSGTGIGLAICQRIVERYHGRIWVESTPGRGSKFHFTLPA
jgi:PAS domain S-box-containing protein